MSWLATLILRLATPANTNPRAKQVLAILADFRAVGVPCVDLAFLPPPASLEERASLQAGEDAQRAARLRREEQLTSQGRWQSDAQAGPGGSDGRSDGASGGDGGGYGGSLLPPATFSTVAAINDIDRGLSAGGGRADALKKVSASGGELPAYPDAAALKGVAVKNNLGGLGGRGNGANAAEAPSPRSPAKGSAKALPGSHYGGMHGFLWDAHDRQFVPRMPWQVRRRCAVDRF